MHSSFPYEGRGSRSEYGRRGDSLAQHPVLEDQLTLHSALSAAVDDPQVILFCLIPFIYDKL